MRRWCFYLFCILFLTCVFVVSVNAQEEEEFLPPPVVRHESWATPTWTGNNIYLEVDGRRTESGDTVYLPSPATASLDLEFTEPTSAKATKITYGLYKGVLNEAELIQKHTLSAEDIDAKFVDSFSEDFSFEEEGDYFIFVYRYCEEIYEGYCADHPTDEQIEKWITEDFDGHDGTPEWPPKEWGYVPFHVWFYRDISWVEPSWTEEDGSIFLEINNHVVSDGDVVEIEEGKDLDITIVHSAGMTDFTRLILKGELNQGAQILCNNSQGGSSTMNLATTSAEITVGINTKCEHGEIPYTAEEGNYFIVAMQARECRSGESCPSHLGPGELVYAQDKIEWIKNGDDGDSETTEFPPKYWGTISFTLQFVPEGETKEQEENTEEDSSDEGETDDEIATSTPAGNSNIAFLHGIKASRLYVKQGGEFVKVWEPNWNNDVKKLYLDDSGESINTAYVGDTIAVAGITGVPVKLSIYDDFFIFLDELKADGSINDWRDISYDWRQSLEDIVTNPIRHIDGTNKTMVEIIEELAANSENGKVTIIGHSNGGLVGKVLISELEKIGKESLIDQFITIGTPHLGTPQTVPSILHGYGQEVARGLILMKSIGREFAVNAPGAYTLLPSDKYFFRVDDPPVVIEESVETQKLFDAYGGSIDSYDEITNFLRGDEGREDPEPTELYKPYKANTQLLNESQALQQNLDGWMAPSGVETTNFVGWGRDTIKGIRYYTRRKPLCIINIFGTCTYLDYAPIWTRDGDKTVVTASAKGNQQHYYLNLSKYHEDDLGKYIHDNLSNFPPLHQMLEQLITQQATTSSPYITTIKPDNKNRDDILMLSLHSPVTMTVIDHSGNEVGTLDFDSTDIQFIKEDIPGASYVEFGEGKYVLIDVDDIAEVQIEGYEKGHFTVGISEAYGDAHYSFDNIETTASTTATLAIGEAIEDSVLNVDYEGDGSTDDSFNLEQEEITERGGGGIAYIINTQPEPQVAGEMIITKSLTQDVSQLVFETQLLIDAMPLLQELDQGQQDRLVELLEEVKQVLKRYDKINSADL